MSKFKNFITNHFNLSVFFILTIVVFSLYGKTLFFDWSYYDDDLLIIDKQEYLSFSNIKNILSTTVFGQEEDKFCRPVLNLTFLCEKYLYGIKPYGYHFTNIILHLFAVFSIFLFLTLRYDKEKTLVLCLLFLCHPALTQAVAWIPGRNDSLLTFFVVLSFYFFIKYLNNDNKNFLLVHLFFFALSLFTKETAIIVPIFYFFFLYFNNKTNIKKFSCCAIIWLLIIVLYLIYRYFVLSYQSNSINLKNLIITFFKSFLLITKYIANIFFPVKLSVFPTMLEINTLLCITSILVFVLLFIKFKKYNLKFIFFGFAWFFLFLFPTFIMPDNKCFDHRIYLPLVGIIIVVLELLNKYDKMLRGKSVIFFILFFSLFFLRSFFYENNFKNKEVFWVNAYIMSPDNDVVNATLGGMLLERGLYKEAAMKYLRAIELNPTSKHYVNLSVVYCRIGNFDIAEKLLLQSLNLSKENPNAYYNLSLIYKFKNEKEKAQEMKNKYIEIFNKTNKVSKINTKTL